MRSVPGFIVDVHREGGAVVVAPSGELDLVTVERVRLALREARETPVVAVVLDLREVSFIDSAGLQLVLEEHRRAERDGVEFRIRRGPNNVQRLFVMTGLSRHLRWADEQAPVIRNGVGGDG
jgi:anti-sigma B factor antagonist